MRLLLVLLSLFAAAVSAKPALTLPYYDWDRCPFEGCTYQEWTTKQEVLARAEPSPTAKVLFRVPRNQKVQGLTGVVITEKAGTVTVLKPVKLGYNERGEGPLLNMKTGERLDTLGSIGEGAMLFWYQGNFYTLDYDDEGTEIRYGQNPKNQWWVKIRDNNGREGWVAEANNFAHMDRFE
ncbi:SH3 domain-containing protein [Aeromonas finlandensis]|uniref:SH3 domain-containing protein n=1 Tax=Aeromonas finlandensis TaxID=1543375 RepID=UPI00051C23AC|nr:SH3 domain-containing protein [Aeromonas finlandensis]